MLTWKALLIVTSIVIVAGFLASLAIYHRRFSRRVHASLGECHEQFQQAQSFIVAAERLRERSDANVADSRLAMAAAVKPVEQMQLRAG